MPDRPTLLRLRGLEVFLGVVVAALVYRAHELEHIDDKRYRSLQIRDVQVAQVRTGHVLPDPRPTASPIGRV